MDSLLLKGKFPLVCRRVIIFDGKKITMGSMHLSEHISNTSNLVNPGRQETRTTGAHLCSQILRTAFCTLPPGRSWFNGICVGPRGHVNITETVRRRFCGWSCRPSCHASASFFTSSVSWKPNKNDSKGVKTYTKLGGKYLGWVNKQKNSANH